MMRAFKSYNNPSWEPVFHEISPFLARLYFATNIGLIRRTIARLIFKKLSWIERKIG